MVKLPSAVLVVLLDGSLGPPSVSNFGRCMCVLCSR
jgi:hypothetical protein